MINQSKISNSSIFDYKITIPNLEQYCMLKKACQINSLNKENDCHPFEENYVRCISLFCQELESKYFLKFFQKLMEFLTSYKYEGISKKVLQYNNLYLKEIKTNQNVLFIGSILNPIYEESKKYKDELGKKVLDNFIRGFLYHNSDIIILVIDGMKGYREQYYQLNQFVKYCFTKNVSIQKEENNLNKNKNDDNNENNGEEKNKEIFVVHYIDGDNKELKEKIIKHFQANYDKSSLNCLGDGLGTSYKYTEKVDHHKTIIHCLFENKLCQKKFSFHNQNLFEFLKAEFLKTTSTKKNFKDVFGAYLDFYIKQLYPIKQGLRVKTGYKSIVRDNVQYNIFALNRKLIKDPKIDKCIISPSLIELDPLNRKLDYYIIILNNTLKIGAESIAKASCKSLTKNSKNEYVAAFYIKKENKNIDNIYYISWPNEQNLHFKMNNDVKNFKFINEITLNGNYEIQYQLQEKKSNDDDDDDDE